MNRKMASYWPDEAQRLAAENRELLATLYRHELAVRYYQLTAVGAVACCILLAMGVM